MYNFTIPQKQLSDLWRLKKYAGKGAIAAQIREAIRLTSNPPWYFLNGLAWVLSTHPDPNVRDANEATRLATRAQALRLNKYHDMMILDTLAAAYAAAGQFDKAVDTAQEAITLTSEIKSEEWANEIRKRLELYKEGKPYIVDPNDLKALFDAKNQQSEIIRTP